MGSFPSVNAWYRVNSNPVDVEGEGRALVEAIDGAVRCTREDIGLRAIGSTRSQLRGSSSTAEKAHGLYSLTPTSSV
jgi:hypothetical protein